MVEHVSDTLDRVVEQVIAAYESARELWVHNRSAVITGMTHADGGSRWPSDHRDPTSEMDSYLRSSNQCISIIKRLMVCSAKYLRGRIVGALGGQAAEDIVCGDMTTGAESDLEQVTRIARQMVGRGAPTEPVPGLPPEDVPADAQDGLPLRTRRDS